MSAESLHVESAVRERYDRGARAAENALCCPTDYDPRYLQAIPREILERDYGCGDPSRYVAEGETVLDLGCGGGKICYILAQVVGPRGHVIGVDLNDQMLALARRHQPQVTQSIGHDNVSFRKGRIQDLKLDVEAADRWLAANPVHDTASLAAYEAEAARLRETAPLIPNDTIDVIVSNCVLNLVQTEQKRHLFHEMFGVLRKGGRCVISDIVCDEEPTPEMQNDPELWSGCISGALREAQFLKRFEEAGFYGVEILERQETPWRVVHGIEFRSVTVRACKGKQGPCLERNQAVIYRGPWKQVVDDDGHVLRRGQRMAVCDKTFKLYTQPDGPYAEDIVGIEPREPIALEDAAQYNCKAQAQRHPRVTKGLDYDQTTEPTDDCGCGPDGCG
jgi:ubiquinone/menaquinone biosynthesis C-methylase UbiE